MKTKRALTNKKQRQIQKRRRRRDAQNLTEIFLHRQYSKWKKKIMKN